MIETEGILEIHKENIVVEVRLNLVFCRLENIVYLESYTFSRCEINSQGKIVLVGGNAILKALRRIFVVAYAHLEALADICRYAPTGSNRQTVEITIIQDRDKIQRLADHTVDFFENSIEELEKEAKECEAGGREVPQITKSALTMLDTLKLVVIARKLGMEVIFHRAPAVMLFHSPTETSTPKDDCVIASTTVTLAAKTLSLETCYIGLFEFVANRYQPIVEELGLPPGHKVYSILVLGYPKLKFLRAVDRKPMKVRWL